MGSIHTSLLQVMTMDRLSDQYSEKASCSFGFLIILSFLERAMKGIIVFWTKGEAIKMQNEGWYLSSRNQLKGDQ